MPTEELPQHIAVPLTLQFLIGFTNQSLFTSLNTFLVDYYPDQSASAQAANNLIRCEMAAAGLAVVDTMIQRLGVEAAQQVDDLYSNEYLPSDPLMKFQDDKGMGGFLSCLYEMVFDLARAIPHEDDLQDRLVQFLVELAKLPTEEVKIWGEDCLVYARNPAYSVVQDDNWNSSYRRPPLNPIRLRLTAWPY
ncbi:uncharacterized protein PG986_014672 [Apiospora aurea]|uniref:Uncharacterized protein n=1 Tax=Apiospora aurea TaxID=335848 RepID=A0ABR1PTM7_9PEZI